MKIVEPYAKMLNCYNLEIPEFRLADGVQMLKRIEYYARVSHASEDKITEDSHDRFLRSVLGKGDYSVIEHEKVTCEFLVDRGITHEIVRHRIGSYTQESTRFINYKKKGGEAKFIYPLEYVPPKPWDDNLDDLSTAVADEMKVAWPQRLWKAAMHMCEQSYMTLLDAGVAPQIARSVLPNALASKIIVTYNLRAWRHFFIMRTSAEAHPQMRQVTVPLLAEFQSKIPIIFEDLVAGESQKIAMGRLR